MEDLQIIDLYWERNERAIPETDTKYGHYCTTIAKNILGNIEDTEECVNDTYLGAWNAIPPHKPSPLRTFVCKIARNLATMKYHANTAEKRNSHYDVALDELEECLAESSSVEEEYDVKELSEAINTFLSTLNYSDRFIFVRRYWYSDSPEYIAKMADSTTNSVTVRLYRLRKKLRYYLMKEGLLV